MKQHVLQSTVTEDGVLRVVLRIVSGSMPLVTHLENVKTGGYSHGNYFDPTDENDGEMAIRDFLARCRQYKVKPEFDLK